MRYSVLLFISFALTVNGASKDLGVNVNVNGATYVKEGASYPGVKDICPDET